MKTQFYKMKIMLTMQKPYWKDKKNRWKRVWLTLWMVLEEGWATVVTIGGQDNGLPVLERFFG